MNGRVMNEAGPQNLLVERQSCEMNTTRRRLIDEREKGEKRRDTPYLSYIRLRLDEINSQGFSTANLKITRTNKSSFQPLAGQAVALFSR